MDFILNWQIRSRLSKYRQPLMGFAIIWVFMLHTGEIGNPLWDSISSWGWSGVDIFFFLSAIGLCYSLNKDGNLDVTAFYKRRAKRILPTWMLVLFSVHLIGILFNNYFNNFPIDVPDSLIKCITWYSGLGFWFSDFVSSKGWFYEWYVPSLLFFYMVTPYLAKKNNKDLFVLFAIFFICGYLLGIYSNLHNLHFFYHRIPVFIMGVIFYRLMKSQDRYFNLSTILCLGLGIFFIFIKTYIIVDIPKEYVVLFLCPPFLILLSYIIEFIHANKVLSFFGGISLELYLIHLYKRPQNIMSFFFKDEYITIALTLVFCTIAAVFLQRVAGKVSKKIVCS